MTPSSRPLPSAPRRDRANLLHAAGIAAERLEERVAAGSGPTITLSRDEAQAIAEQFGRLTALLTLAHLAEAGVRPRPSTESAA